MGRANRDDQGVVEAIRMAMESAGVKVGFPISVETVNEDGKLDAAYGTPFRGLAGNAFRTGVGSYEVDRVKTIRVNGRGIIYERK